ncbi:hypothetical protein ACHAXS_003063 [Conticribra weissflogii]
MMGVPIYGATNVFGDNMSIIKSTSTSECTLNMKNVAVCYHRVRGQSQRGNLLHSISLEQKSQLTL